MAKRGKNRGPKAFSNETGEAAAAGVADAVVDANAVRAEEPAEAAAGAETAQPSGADAAKPLHGGDGPILTESDNGQEAGPVSEGQQDPAAPGAGDTAVEGDQPMVGAAAGGSAGEASMAKVEGVDDIGEARPSIAATASMAAAIAGNFVGGDWDPGQPMFTDSEAAVMVDFVRANPDAPTEAMFIHLSLATRIKPRPLDREDMVILNVFHRVATECLAYDKHVQAMLEASSPPAAPAGNAWPGDLALTPQPGAFDPAGFSPRR